MLIISFIATLITHYEHHTQVLAKETGVYYEREIATIRVK